MAYTEMISYNKKFVKSIGDKRILILGFGREGHGTFLFLRKIFPHKTFGIADQNPKLVRLNLGRLETVRLHLGKRYLGAIKNYDVIIKSPGIAPKLIAPFVSKKQRVTSQTEIFFELCPGKIIGVTGTKGKSTTTSMIYEILRDAGFRAHLVGNIGKPALSSLASAGPNDIFVYELSSHQLYGLKKSPHVAVFLNIYPEHLDYYRNFAEYGRAKANICLWQNKDDYLIFNAKDRLVCKFAQKSKAHKISVTGKYYGLDKAAAREAGRISGVSNDSIEKTLKNFQYLPHRLELVGVFQGITFYNDSLATIPQATIAALDLLGSRVETLIAGGFDRGIDFRPLAEGIWRSRVKTVILFPESGKRIIKEVTASEKGGGIKYFAARNMREAISLAFLHTKTGKICLLSPASPSFGLFRDYRDRGNAYKRAVKSFSKKPRRM